MWRRSVSTAATKTQRNRTAHQPSTDVRRRHRKGRPQRHRHRAGPEQREVGDVAHDDVRGREELKRTGRSRAIRNGNPPPRFHSCPHIFASPPVMAGLDVYIVQRAGAGRQRSWSSGTGISARTTAGSRIPDRPAGQGGGTGTKTALPPRWPAYPTPRSLAVKSHEVVRREVVHPGPLRGDLCT